MNSSGTKLSAGSRFRAALDEEVPLQIAGVINAFCALQAASSGFRALYLSGAGVANASFGIPDIGETTLTDVVLDAERITGVSDLPLLVDADTGWEHGEGVAETVRRMERAGVAGMHLEDQVSSKRCGHLQGKGLVQVEQMLVRIREAVSARGNSDFVIMARTDAVASEGLEGGIERARRYRDCGADMIFAEALTSLDDYRRFVEAVEIPVLANLTEFGRTPLFTVEQMRETGVKMLLYPLSAFRAMNAAASAVYNAIRTDGHQGNVMDQMQTRAELYKLLGYSPEGTLPAPPDIDE